MADAIRVEGLRELVRAYQVANREMAKDVRVAIEEAGEPIRQEAQQLVRSEISGMARSRVPWWTIRTGVERSSIGYIVPQQKGVSGRAGRLAQTKRGRPNLAPLIAEREERARDANTDRVVDEFTQALERVARVWARV